MEEPDFKTLFNSLPDPYLILTPDLMIAGVNDAYLKATMTEREKIVGRPLFEIFPDNPGDPNADGARNLRASLNRVLINKKPDTMAVQKYDIRRPESKGGGFEVRYWSPVNTPLFKKGTDEITHIIHHVEDVTEFVTMRNIADAKHQQMQVDILLRSKELQASNQKLREAEEKLRKSHEELEDRVFRRTEELARAQRKLVQQERLRALGELASGIAHDFNNALSPILGYSEIMLETDVVKNNPQHADYLKIINTSAKDAATIVSRLRQFGQAQDRDENFKPLDLKQLAEDVIKLTKPKWQNQALARGIEIKALAEIPEPVFIKGHEQQLREVLTNLIFNAVDAMDKKNGQLTLRGYSEQKFAVLEVSDTGAGMSEEVKNKCLEPFYTTKGESGTGLGLSLVYGIVKRHGGVLDVSSELGKGTTFTMRFPVTQGICEIKIPAGGGRLIRSLSVLYVEDNPKVREVMMDYLTKDGHRVKTAVNGIEALQIFYEEKDCFDLVLTDHAMPQLGGEQLAKAIRSIAPDQPIIMLSGTSSVVERKSEHINIMLTKPITLEDLRKALRKLFQ
jgi:signal transduction histidine kinase/CheY-like chemotaxis protein